MANQTDMGVLQRERDKHEAALSAVQEKITAIEEDERREREKREQKARELANLKQKQESCRKWISFMENKLAELRDTASRQLDRTCEGDSEIFIRLNLTMQDIIVWERQLAAFRDYDSSLGLKIEAMAGDKA